MHFYDEAEPLVERSDDHAIKGRFTLNMASSFGDWLRLKIVRIILTAR
jgi:hypothetical protein